MFASWLNYSQIYEVLIQCDARGSFVGTYNYMAPETIGNCSTVLESDLWALGCIVFKMATGKIMIPGKQLF